MGRPFYLNVPCIGYHILVDVWDQTKHNKRQLLPVSTVVYHWFSLNDY